MSDLNTEVQRHREGCARSPRPMRDSGVEWLGQVPEGWKILPSRTLFSEVKEKNDDGKETRQFSFRYGQIVDKDKSGRSDVTTEETITAYRVVTPDTIMINGLNLNYDFISQRVAIVKERGIITSAYLALTPKKDLIEPSYALYLFKGYDSKQVFHGHGSGIRKTLNYSDFAEIKSVLPPLPEQRAIAAYLDERCAKIDAMVADAKKLIEEYKQWKSSLIFEAVTGKCRIENGKCKMGGWKLRDSGVDWIGQVPEVWAVNHLKRVINERDGGAWGEDPEGQEIESIPCMRIADFLYGKGRFKSEGLTRRCYAKGQVERLLLRHGDLCVEKSGGGEKTPVGRCVIFDLNFPALFTNFMDRLRVDHEFVDPLYFMYWWRGMYTKTVTTMYIKQTTGIQNLDLTDMLSEQWIACPPLPEQRVIAAYLDMKCAAIDRVVAEKEGLIVDLEKYKKSLIFECVTGKREVV